jgi:hypothetical protein
MTSLLGTQRSRRATTIALIGVVILSLGLWGVGPALSRGAPAAKISQKTFRLFPNPTPFPACRLQGKRRRRKPP